MHMAPQEAGNSPLGLIDSQTIMRPDTKGKARLTPTDPEEVHLNAEKKAPLNLKDLPEDVLCEIIKQLPHTNDLTSLALCHSVFHSLCVPCIYSRFDIVWPDVNVDTSSRAGVDALTYGLSTLVMAEEVFRETPWQRKLREDQARLSSGSTTAPQCAYPVPRRRRGNNFAQYTKKFSLGNGPTDWVQEYLITKEGGKMLGTLVALAVARMHNLETFIWDMPTGVLRDIWLALSSLADRDDGQDCRLDKVWIRWHDNFETDSPQPHGFTIPPPPPPLNIAPVIHMPPMPPPIPPPMPAGLASIPPPVLAVAMPPVVSLTFPPVETPNFSILPPLRSLSVLDIDELAYLDEISILVARSLPRLRELRIGIAKHAQTRGVDWLREWEGDDIHQVDHVTAWTLPSKIGARRLGGVLGVLVGRIFNLQNNARTQKRRALSSETRGDLSILTQTVDSKPDLPVVEEVNAPGGEAISNVAVDPAMQSDSATKPATLPLRSAKPLPIDTRNFGPYLNSKLEIETLELERVPLSMTVLTQAIDWSRLTALTLLDCQNHETLWRLLRRQYTPANQAQKQTTSRSYTIRPQYGLNLKKIHTDTVSNALIALLKETLAPNSLEVLFLQEGRGYTSGVSVGSIFKGPLQRHRNSLKKLLIDSSGGDGDHVDNNARWRRWMLNNEVVWFLLSGKMTALRELGITIAYAEWHFLLQNLPNLPHLRSLYLPHIGDHPHGSNIAPMDLVNHIINIVSLRPSMELCYVGMMNKCFEILETRPPRIIVGTPVDADAYAVSAATPAPAIGTAAWMNQNTSTVPIVDALLHPTVQEHEDSEESEVDEDVALEGEVAMPVIQNAALSATPSPELITTAHPPASPPIPAPLLNHPIIDAVFAIQPPTSMMTPASPSQWTLNTSASTSLLPANPPPLSPSAGMTPFLTTAVDESDDDADTFAEVDSIADIDGTDADPEGEDYGRAEWEDMVGARFSVREILFYDDKVEVFRARHGRL